MFWYVTKYLEQDRIILQIQNMPALLKNHLGFVSESTVQSPLTVCVFWTEVGKHCKVRFTDTQCERQCSRMWHFQTVKANAPWIGLWEENFIVYKSYIDIRSDYELWRRKLLITETGRDTVRHKVLVLTVGCISRNKIKYIFQRIFPINYNLLTTSLLTEVFIRVDKIYQDEERSLVCKMQCCINSTANW